VIIFSQPEGSGFPSGIPQVHSVREEPRLVTAPVNRTVDAASHAKSEAISEVPSEASSETQLETPAAANASLPRTTRQARLQTFLGGVRFWPRFLQLNTGLILLGLAQVLMLKATVGLYPWAVFHQGVSLAAGMTYGQALQVTGLVVVGLGWWLAGQRPGLGTVSNMLLVGVWVDVIMLLTWFPTPEALTWRLLQFLVSVVITGYATGLYVNARLGAGPRDGLVIGLAQRLGLSLRVVRSGLEALVLGAGLLLGGAAGIGTLLFVLLSGPVMQFFVQRLAPKRS
jgi:uncharacterized membrane protein YczE